ncbi:hypothetical protein B4134_0860 [Bacillus safensis]|uniref:hypothetical protein n=1 Tax=Bacillus safensis TaxID=561879 RepID=UPI0005971AE9|nr:hypothetical protein [Bacillus safensis]KIL23550.1 hypothetical protein B4134_0860 [Bacillus safensis]
MSGRRIVGAMFICMAGLFYIAKYVLFEIRYSNSLGSERTIEELEQLLPGGTWISIFFLIIGSAYLLWDDREVLQKNFVLSDKQVEEIKKTDLK